MTTNFFRRFEPESLWEVLGVRKGVIRIQVLCFNCCVFSRSFLSEIRKSSALAYMFLKHSGKSQHTNWNTHLVWVYFPRMMVVLHCQQSVRKLPILARIKVAGCIHQVERQQAISTASWRFVFWSWRVKFGCLIACLVVCLFVCLFVCFCVCRGYIMMLWCVFGFQFHGKCFA